MNPELLWVFIPTIAAISLTPGMCMTLAFTLGLSQGYRRTVQRGKARAGRSVTGKLGVAQLVNAGHQALPNPEC